MADGKSRGPETRQEARAQDCLRSTHSDSAGVTGQTTGVRAFLGLARSSGGARSTTTKEPMDAATNM